MTVSRFSPLPLALAVILAVALDGRQAGALDRVQRRHVKNFITLDATGNAGMTSRMIMPSTDEYQKLKTDYPNPHSLVRHLQRSVVKAVLHDMAGTFDDQEKAAVMSGKRLAAAALRRGRWEVQLDVPYNLLHAAGRNVVMLYTVLTPPNTLATDLLKITLPEGARDVSYNQEKRLLSYALDRTPAIEGPARLDCELEARRRIASSLYKLYGQPELNMGGYWVARTVLENAGASDITDIRIRYRVGDYATWSPEARYDILIPGAALVDWYYPIFSSTVLELANTSPVDVEMRVTYRDAAGERHEDGYSRRASLLGRGQFENSPLKQEDVLGWADRYLNAFALASFSTKADPIVREFAALASRISGGGVMQSTDQAVAFCKAVYDLLKNSGIACDNPPAFFADYGGETMNVKFPREVLRDRSGTSLDLALLFSAVCESMGLPTGIGILPGACYLMVRFPSGTALPFDLAVLGGGGSLDDAYAAGKKLHDKKDAPNDRIFIDIHGSQREGMTSPDLPPLPAGTLAGWGYK